MEARLKSVKKLRGVITSSLIFVLIVFMTVIMIYLGFWQLRRANESQAILDRFNEQSIVQATSLSKALSLKDKRYRMVKVEGYYDNEHPFLLDNQFHQHQVGYHVISVLKIPGQKQRLLIDRGWVPMQGARRRHLPQILPVENKVTVYGKIHQADKHLLLLGNIAEQGNDWPRLIQQINFDYIHQVLGAPVYPFVIQLEKGQMHGYVRDWKPVMMSPQRHKVYAVQWFIMAFTLIILSIVLVMTRRKQREQVDA
jgi:surfeit locus 1 family protein